MISTIERPTIERPTDERPAATSGPTEAGTARGAVRPAVVADVERLGMDRLDIDRLDIDRLAWDVERTGHLVDEDVVGRMVDAARPAGVNPVLIDVLGDRSEPECARIRAFGRVALHLGARRLAA